MTVCNIPPRIEKLDYSAENCISTDKKFYGKCLLRLNSPYAYQLNKSFVTHKLLFKCEEGKTKHREFSIMKTCDLPKISIPGTMNFSLCNLSKSGSRFWGRCLVKPYNGYNMSSVDLDILCDKNGATIPDKIEVQRETNHFCILPEINNGQYKIQVPVKINDIVVYRCDFLYTSHVGKRSARLNCSDFGLETSPECRLSIKMMILVFFLPVILLAVLIFIVILFLYLRRMLCFRRRGIINETSIESVKSSSKISSNFVIGDF
ncbi:hypothetical protein MHBO_000120 [Bonamia ostreae]|uniref:Uncharacterized protein n=1 Tax=Bonamia ostreae TaxID=126728 RepID=A0ABV2AF67_9EUKA